MPARLQFEIIFDEAVEYHLDTIERREHSLILDEIENQLLYQATVQARNRKPMRVSNTLGATWELRCGMNNRYCVFYDVSIDERIVVILAIGRKLGTRLYIGQEEFII